MRRTQQEGNNSQKPAVGWTKMQPFEKCQGSLRIAYHTRLGNHKQIHAKVQIQVRKTDAIQLLQCHRLLSGVSIFTNKRSAAWGSHNLQRSSILNKEVGTHHWMHPEEVNNNGNKTRVVGGTITQIKAKLEFLSYQVRVTTHTDDKNACQLTENLSYPR